MSIDIISLGAGVQSSTLLVKADRGEFKIDGETVIPKYAIMSDTGNEPEKVYEWLEYLRSIVKNIEIVVTNNGNIIDNTLRGIEHNERFASVPFFVVNKKPIYEQIKIGTETIFDEDLNDYIEVDKYENGKLLDVKKENGILWRQCTGEYKIRPVRNKIKELLGYGRRQRVKEHIRLWMGISTDEIQRVKPSQVKWLENYFPLIENEMSRFDCLKWFRNNDLPLPPKSSCIVCPYHSNQTWLGMKRNDKDSWKMAVEFDKKIRHLPKVNGECFLHRSCVPLEEADLQEDQFEMDLFDNECEGMCGV